MPPPAAAEFSVAQLTLLVLLVEVVLLLLLELEEHAAVTSRLAATAAIAEIAGLARNIPSQTRSRGGTRCRSLARQVEMMASEYKHWVSVRFPAGIR
jgi:hypothetical protein